jgi:hypothetical protein
MFPQLLLAFLTNSAGQVLLVRRKDSHLWSLPGSLLHAAVESRTDFLAACCRRQIGVTPVFCSPLRHVSLATVQAAIARDEVPTDRVRACGRVADTAWFSPDALPVELAPVARLVIAGHVHPETEFESGALLAAG